MKAPPVTDTTNPYLNLHPPPPPPPNHTRKRSAIISHKAYTLSCTLSLSLSLFINTDLLGSVVSVTVSAAAITLGIVVEVESARHES